jgi:hypothetical protein
MGHPCPEVVILTDGSGRTEMDGRLRPSGRKPPITGSPSDRGAPCVNPLTFYFFITNIAYNTGCCDKTQSILNRHICFYYIFS